MSRRNPERILAAKVVWALFAAGVALALALGQAGVWRAERGAMITLIVAAAAISVLSTLFGAYGEFRRQRGEALSVHARAILVPLAFVLQDQTGIDVRDLGIAAYIRQRVWWWPVRERLVRVYRERPRLASASGVRWRPGAGVIGRCVELGQDVCVDLAGLDELLTGVTAAEWKELDAGLTLGLTFSEYQRLRGRFGVVLATPILVEYPTGAQIVGCVAVDGMAGTYDRISSRDVRAQAASAAELLAEHF